MIQWVDCEEEKPKAFATVWVRVNGKKKPIKAWWSFTHNCWCRKLDNPTGRLWGTDLHLKKGEVTHWKKIQKPAYVVEE